jgi:predicted RNA-binding protein with PIN domain
MSYIIDGHNLIPHIPGLSLRDLDDEMRLVEILQEYARKSRKKVEVFFDKAPAGQARTIKSGLVTVHFVRIGSSADSAIIARVRKLGKVASNYVVVTSDRRIQHETEAVHARGIDSADFARELNIQLTSLESGSKSEPVSPPEEVEEWLKIFSRDDKKGPGF